MQYVRYEPWEPVELVAFKDEVLKLFLYFFLMKKFYKKLPKLTMLPKLRKVR